MKSVSVLLRVAVLVTIMMAVNSKSLAQGAAAAAPAKKMKVVSVTFTPEQAKKRRFLSRAEAVRQAASVRHEKRLQAGYNQPIPF